MVDKYRRGIGSRRSLIVVQQATDLLNTPYSLELVMSYGMNQIVPRAFAPVKYLYLATVAIPKYVLRGSVAQR